MLTEKCRLTGEAKELDHTVLNQTAKITLLLFASSENHEKSLVIEKRALPIKTKRSFRVHGALNIVHYFCFSKQLVSVFDGVYNLSRQIFG